MKNANRNSLLMEIAIVVLFFALASGTLLKLFTQNFENNRLSRTRTQAVIEVQDLSEALKASFDMQKTLKENGFSFEDGEWTLEMPAFRIIASVEKDERGAGFIETASLTAKDGDFVYVNCTASQYFPSEVQP
ncbi:MAG: hypothetical protein IJB25_11855 [Clostridia bacterium]|nr:hypothetical protein [Clostridia bacterium]